MKIFQTQADFLKAFPIKDGFINLEYNSVELLFNLLIPSVSIVNALDIKALDIKALDINARDINAWDINAWDINAWNINAQDIKACNINAQDINARNINARDIKYYAICSAYQNITCKSIIGTRENAKHFCLDGKVIIKI